MCGVPQTSPFGTAAAVAENVRGIWTQINWPTAKVQVGTKSPVQPPITESPTQKDSLMPAVTLGVTVTVP